MITLLHGPAELLRAEALAQIRATIAEDPGMVELNATVLDGRHATLAELRFACEALPFLAERRLVVVEGLLRRLSSAARPRAKAGAEAAPAGTGDEQDDSPDQAQQQTKGLQEALLAYLGEVPESAELVLVEDDLVAGGAVLRRLTELQRAGRAHIIGCSQPKKSELPAWIRTRAKTHQLQLDAAAVADLAEFVGDDLRLLDQELIKLSDYAAGQGKASGARPLGRADVRRLVAATRAANVFELVEALSAGNTSVAARLLRQALDADGEQPLRLLALISRQYRLLIEAKALQAQDVRPVDMARQLGVPDWTVPKLLSQAARHSFAVLERDMERLLAADEAIKTGKLGDREAMDVLLAELALAPGARS